MVQREVLEKIPSPMLAAYLVWLPVMPNDNEYHANGAQRLATDARAQHYWNADQRLGLDLMPALPLGAACELAWDVYLVYPRRVKWSPMRPPAPSFWMHQLNCMSSQELRLNGEALRVAVERELSQSENANANFQSSRKPQPFGLPQRID